MLFSLVQLVAGVVIAYQPCPAYSQPTSCYDPASRIIYLAKYDWHNRMTILHEYGHAYDYDGHVDHKRFTKLLGWPRNWEWWQTDRYGQSPGEDFAEAYAICAEGRYDPICKYLPKMWTSRVSAAAATPWRASSP